jgi:hypothetical protein
VGGRDPGFVVHALGCEALGHLLRHRCAGNFVSGLIISKLKIRRSAEGASQC